MHARYCLAQSGDECTDDRDLIVHLVVLENDDIVFFNASNVTWHVPFGLAYDQKVRKF